MEAQVIQWVTQCFEALPTRGKPKPTEWTVLAAALAVIDDKVVRLLALTTGTKCVGKDKLADDGGVLNDCHAEVLARRALKRFLLREAQAVLEGRPSCFLSVAASDSSCEAPKDTQARQDSQQPRRVLKVKDSIKFLLFISETPCGDASIYTVDDGESAAAADCRSVSEIGTAAPSRQRLNIMRETGAKPIASQGEDTATSTHLCQSAGVLRTKSARSDTLESRRTVCMCCSDKIAQWVRLGFQGSLLSFLLDTPQRFSNLILAVGGSAAGPTSDLIDAKQHRMWTSAVLKSTARAVLRGVGRGSDVVPPSVYVDTRTKFCHSRRAVQWRLHQVANTRAGVDISASNSKRAKRQQKVSACGTSIVWIHLPGVPASAQNATVKLKSLTQFGEQEVLVSAHGLKQGAKKRKRAEPTNAK